jgi:hypothetical protein
VLLLELLARPNFLANDKPSNSPRRDPMPPNGAGVFASRVLSNRHRLPALLDVVSGIAAPQSETGNRKPTRHRDDDVDQARNGAVAPGLSSMKESVSSARRSLSGSAQINMLISSRGIAAILAQHRVVRPTLVLVRYYFNSRQRRVRVGSSAKRQMPTNMLPSALVTLRIT